MRVLLTGVSSCIGQYVYELLEKDKSIEELVCVSRKAPHYFSWYPPSQRVKLVDCRLDCRMSVSRLLSEYKPGAIIHLAGLGKQQAGIHDHYKDNVLTTINLLEYAPNGTRFVYLSTVLTHENLPLNPYILSKRMAEDLALYYHFVGKVDACIIKPCAIVGRGSTHGILPDVIRKIREPGDSITLKGRYPGSSKPYVYAGDLAQKIYHIMQNRDVATEIYYGPPTVISSAGLAELVMRHMKVTKKILFDGIEWSGDQKVVAMPENTVYSSSVFNAIKKGLEDIHCCK